MRQILQSLKNGDTSIVEAPTPQNLPGHLLIQSNTSLVSAGTERMLINFGKANYLTKARQQPDKVKQVLGKINTDGILATFDSVKSKLDQPIPLGYCNSGVIVDCQSTNFKVGERVISNGSHADFVRVPENLCAKIPDNVGNEAAAFTIIGAIALQGIRLISPSLGETVVVTGLGLIGLMAVQILKANGCRVIGIDYDTNKCALAKSFGAETVNLSLKEDPIMVSKSFSRGRGVDAVLITASTDSSEPMSHAANMLRQRGRIVLVGVVGLTLSRAELYEKEISFQVSCSYGPGRYDPNYEEDGNDYPIGFVRWTEQRNFEAILDMLSDGTLNVEHLISHRYEFSDAITAYSQLDEPGSLGILLNYNDAEVFFESNEVSLKESVTRHTGQNVVCGFLGAGNYASRVLIPAFKKANTRLEILVTSSGLNSRIHGKKNGFFVASTNEKSVLESSLINTVVIATRHNLHADQVIAALESNKNVFVEKPLAITLDQIDKIEATYNFDEQAPVLNGHPYATSHHFGEQQVLSVAKNSYLDCTVLRLSNSFGYPVTHQTTCWGLVLNEFIRDAFLKGQITINGDCFSKRDFLPITELNRILIEILYSPELIPEVINVSSGTSKTLLEVALQVSDAVFEFSGTTVELVSEIGPKTDLKLNIKNRALEKIGIFANNDLKLEISKMLDFLSLAAPLAQD